MKKANDLSILGKWTKNIPLSFILIIYSIIVIFPLVWIFSSSLKSSMEIFANVWALPKEIKWENYVNAWIEASIGKYFINSLFVTATSVFFILLLSSMVAYVLTRFRFLGNSFVFYYFLGGLMIPTFLGIVPLFLLLKDLRLLDNFIGLILVYIAYSLPFSIFILTPFFKSLPHELAEAAIIDGCSDFAVFWRIILPLAKPGLITVGIFNFLGIWNEYILALVIISSGELRTLPLGIANLYMVQHYQADWGTLFAGLTIVMVPTLIVYIIFSKKLTSGITLGALKG